jgi:hypothetical protein
MARERPFKDELKAYREALYRPRVPGSDGPDGVGNDNPPDREHLQNWEKDFRAQEIWDKFKEHNPTASPNELIKPVLKMRREARAWPARIAHVSDWPKELHKYYAQRAKEVFARYESLDDVAGEILVLFYEMMDAVHAVEFESRTLLAEKPQHISRQKKTRKRDKTQHDKTQHDDNWGIHRLFIIAINNFWQRQCGRLDDAAVAALTEIAFPDADISAEQVRNVRRSIKAFGRVKTGSG